MVSRLLDAPAQYWQTASGQELTKSDAHAQLSISRDSAMLEVIYSGGLRISEATGLNLGSVDLIGGVASQTVGPSSATGSVLPASF